MQFVAPGYRPDWEHTLSFFIVFLTGLRELSCHRAKTTGRPPSEQLPLVIRRERQNRCKQQQWKINVIIAIERA